MKDIGWPLETGLLRAVFDSVGAGMLIVDTTGRITASNPFAQHILDRPEEQLLGSDAHDLLHRDEDGNEVPRQSCPIMVTLDSGRPAEGSGECYLRGDGTLVPIIWAATPLRHAEGRDGAVIVFHDFRAHRDATEQTAAYLAALEDLTARLSIVAEVSMLFIAKLDISEMFDKLVHLLVPTLGDWAAIDLLPTGEIQEARRVAVYAPGARDAAESLKGPLPPLPRALYNMRPLLLNAKDMAGETNKLRSRPHQRLFDHLGGHTAVMVPLYTRRQVFGLLTVARTGQRAAYTDAEALMLGDIGRRVGLMMESTRLFEEQRDIAETMQRQLLTPLPQAGHLRFAARYQPAQKASEVGGDWYDAFRLADGVMAMVIGDVVGHDLHAAAHMAEVRNMLRALAWDRREPPSLIMQRLDEAMTNTSDAPMATVVFARLEGPEGGPWELRWVNAGHPPPLLVTADGRTRYLEGGHGPLLGMSATLHLGLDWPDAREVLPAHSTLLFYTDGLVESRGHPIDTGLDTLRRHAADLAHADIEDFLDELLSRIEPSGDDVALLALRVPEAGAGAGEGTTSAPPQHAHSPAAPERGAPGSRAQNATVRDTSEPA